LAESADLIVIAPCTADTLARLAGGFADDLLTITALAARCPMLIAPAMDGAMYEHPAVQANVDALMRRGARLIEPEIGRFASGLTGKGRLPETGTLIGAVRRALSMIGVLTGKHIVVTAGGTREALDPVRYLTNRSSGKQGYALAQAALDAGADVTLISAARLESPYGAHVIPVESAAQMLDAVMQHTERADALIMAAAVADFRPTSVSDHKIKKSGDDAGLTIELDRNPDILAAVAARRANTGFPKIAIGFAAESHDLESYAQDKLTRKGLDLLVANDITAADAGFETDTNRVLIFDRHGYTRLDLMSKTRVSEHIIARAADLLRT
jgi:phosphopantothenoylcysteine decarboxylase/phosphopantothenate--cysteine ligase